jgi:hypothetical protein
MEMGCINASLECILDIQTIFYVQSLRIVKHELLDTFPREFIGVPILRALRSRKCPRKA